MTPQEFLELPGEVTWMWTCDFFLETSIGNFVWRNPSYEGGDNVITYTSKTYDEFLKGCSIPYGRSKGIHILKEYLGENVIFTKATLGTLSRF